jgi:hypothetical protein
VSVCVYSVFVLSYVQVAALRLADPSSSGDVLKRGKYDTAPSSSALLALATPEMYSPHQSLDGVIEKRNKSKLHKYLRLLQSII